MKVTVNLKQLYELKRDLFNQIKRHVGGRIYGTETIDLPIAFAEAVKRFQEANPIELWEEQQMQAEKDALKARAEKDQKAALSHFAWWLTQGLENTAENHDRLAKWLDANAGGYLSPDNIDYAIRALGPGGTETLAWKKATAEPVAPAPPVEPPPPPVILSDGSHQLPLGTVPRASRHTLVQLKDLAVREREARQNQIRSQNTELVKTFTKPVSLEV